MEMAPELQVRDKNQISALPLGSRVVVDPWSDRLKLLKAQPVALASAKEKMPFQVTPFVVYLTREGSSSGVAAPAANGSGADHAPPSK
jgi:hypothetical protein